MAIDRIIAGPMTHISNNVGNLLIDAGNDRLYVANGTSILVFNNAGTSEGNISPARTITSPQFGNISSLFLDATNNILYAGDDLNGIWIIDNANSVNGSITPTRSITGNFTATYGGSFSINSLYVDTVRDLLYVSVRIFATGGGTSILVFNNARTANGSGLTPARTIHPSAYAGTIFLDAANDRLYLADPSAYTVRAFDSISTADGSVASNRTISMGISPAGLTVDIASNRLYVLNPSAVFIINNADIADGSVPMTAVLAPSNSILTAITVRQ
ncbi:MAG: hypothetical protein KJ634_14460 [Gammaproteobacteria bacterium]|nr:hypothetical protein [Gammaproteobacteria bacterium]MBU1416816.1 hypothetical protein [Gammaproteobacteria bacterium]